MTITVDQAQALKKAVRQLVRAEVAASMKGQLTDPIDVELVEDELTGSRIRLGGVISRMTDLKADEPVVRKQIVIIKKSMDAPGPDLNKKDPA